jgi:hypothetical protein
VGDIQLANCICSLFQCVTHNEQYFVYNLVCTTLKYTSSSGVVPDQILYGISVLRGKATIKLAEFNVVCVLKVNQHLIRSLYFARYICLVL